MPQMRHDVAMIERVSSRVSPQEKQRMMKAARRLGLSLSEYIREAALRDARAF